jgi:hypothetical protein
VTTLLWRQVMTEEYMAAVRVRLEDISLMDGPGEPFHHDEAPRGQTAPPEGHVDAAPDDGLDELDDEDEEVDADES